MTIYKIYSQLRTDGNGDLIRRCNIVLGMRANVLWRRTIKMVINLCDT